MKVSELIKNLDLEIIAGEESIEKEISGAYVSDLLSDVMGNATEGQIWITLQLHQNTIAVASLREMAAIIIVKGLHPLKETIEAANTENIPLLSTKESCFDISGKIYNLLNN